MRFNPPPRFVFSLLVLITMAFCAEFAFAGRPLAPQASEVKIPFLEPGWSARHGGAPMGELIEISAVPARSESVFDEDDVSSPGLDHLEDFMLELEGAYNDGSDEKMLTDETIGSQIIEFGIGTSDGRQFIYRVKRKDLFKASIGRGNEVAGDRFSRELMEREDEVKKAWSDGVDSRTRRGYADGYSVDDYNMMADYGDCSATIIKATSTYVWALTAAHCLFISNSGSVTSDKLVPRRDGTGTPSKPYGEWHRSLWVYYTSYLNNQCETQWNEDCIAVDIALVKFVPYSSTSTPGAMGRGYRHGDFLQSHSKYRRGYPICSYWGGSPSPCTSNTLYGDHNFSVGEFSHRDGDGWNRIIRHSSDVSDGDSGSGCYYYRDGNAYVFGVQSSDLYNCYSTCTLHRPNQMRRITPSFADLINSML